MTDKLVTIIIPVYNAKQYVKQCIDSVLNQTYNCLQIIIIDDGSTDESGIICDDYLSKDNRIQVIHKNNEGLGLARNTALKYVKGKYICFLDSDDWLSSNHIERMVYDAETSNSDLIVGSRTRFYEDKRYKKLEVSIYGEFQDESVLNIVLPELVSASPKSRIDLGIPMSVCFNLYLTKLIVNNNIVFPSERYCVSEDFFFNYQYIKICHKVKIIKEYGYFYRYTPMSITHHFDIEQMQRVYNFYDEIKKMVLSDNISNDMNMRVYRCSLSIVRSLLVRIISSNLLFNVKINYIKSIIESPQVKEMVGYFDYRQYPFRLQLFTLFIKYHFKIIVYFFLRVKSFVKC